MSGGVGSILIVEADAAERERFGGWLEAAGFDVLVCPGPSEPDSTCVGARDGIYPLPEEADVAVLGSHPADQVEGRLRRLPRHPDRAELLAAVSMLAE